MMRLRTVLRVLRRRARGSRRAVHGQTPPANPPLENPAAQKPATGKPAAGQPSTRSHPPRSHPPRSRPPREAAPRTFPAEPPKPGVPRDFKVPEPKRFTLDNGLAGRPGPVGHDAESAGHAQHAHRQRVRAGERGLARRPDRRSDARRHHDPHRRADFGAGGAHGRVAHGCRGWRQHHDRRRRPQRVRPADGRARRRRRPEPEVPGVGAGAAEGQPAPQPRRLVEPAAADRAAEIPGGHVRRPSPMAGCFRPRT